MTETEGQTDIMRLTETNRHDERERERERERETSDFRWFIVFWP